MLADVFVVQPFTEYIYLGGDPEVDERVTQTAKRFLAFRKAIQDLRSYYRSLRLDDSGPVRAARLPHPTYAVSSEVIHTLRFVDRFRYQGLRSDDPDNYGRSLFSAKLDNKPVLVKFCTQYGAKAHSHLAEHNFAPRLHHCVELVGRVTMVVMDVVEDASIAFYKYQDSDLPNCIVQKVQEAVDTLHAAGFVHGDIRRPNIMVREDDESSVMLIDFDWAGEAGQARYPVTLNQSDSIPWATGTKPRGLIDMTHDDHMVKMLSQCRS